MLPLFHLSFLQMNQRKVCLQCKELLLPASKALMFASIAGTLIVCINRGQIHVGTIAKPKNHKNGVMKANNNADG